MPFYCEVGSFCHKILLFCMWKEEFFLYADGTLWVKMRQP